MNGGKLNSSMVRSVLRKVLTALQPAAVLVKSVDSGTGVGWVGAIDAMTWLVG